MTPFGNVFKELRIKAGLSQVVVATHAEVSTGYIGLIETGQRGNNPLTGCGQAAGSALGAGVFDELEALMRAAGWLGEDDLISTDKPTVKEVVSADPLLDDEGKRLLLGMYDRLTRGIDGAGRSRRTAGRLRRYLR